MGTKLGYCLQTNDAAINVEKETEGIWTWWTYPSLHHCDLVGAARGGKSVGNEDDRFCLIA